jgi:putative endonuclease
MSCPHNRPSHFSQATAAVPDLLIADRSMAAYNWLTMGNSDRTWYIYLLRCADGTLYTGITVDPERREKCHNAGRGSRYTRIRLPVRLLASLKLPSHAEAARLERRIKRYTPKRKLAFFRRGTPQPAPGTD